MLDGVFTVRTIAHIRAVAALTAAAPSSLQSLAILGKAVEGPWRRSMSPLVTLQTNWREES